MPSGSEIWNRFSSLLFGPPLPLNVGIYLTKDEDSSANIFAPKQEKRKYSLPIFVFRKNWMDWSTLYAISDLMKFWDFFLSILRSIDPWYLRCSYISFAPHCSYLTWLSSQLFSHLLLTPFFILDELWFNRNRALQEGTLYCLGLSVFQFY